MATICKSPKQGIFDPIQLFSIVTESVFIRVHLWLKTLAKLAQLTGNAVGRNGSDTPVNARPQGSAAADLLLMTGQNTSVSALIGGTGRKIAMDIKHVVVLMRAS